MALCCAFVLSCFFVFALAFQAKDEPQADANLMAVIAMQIKIDALETHIRVLEAAPTLRVGMCWVVRVFTGFERCCFRFLLPLCGVELPALRG